MCKVASTGHGLAFYTVLETRVQSCKLVILQINSVLHQIDNKFNDE